MRVDFYHLSTRPVDAVLPRLLERVVAGGARALVFAKDGGLLDRLDRELWTYAPESFLPHGRAGGERDADQPVLLAATLAPVNGATCLVLADGEWPAALPDGYDRVFLMFDEERRDGARTAWRTLQGEKHYWRQDERGRWTEGP